MTDDYDIKPKTELGALALLRHHLKELGWALVEDLPIFRNIARAHGRALKGLNHARAYGQILGLWSWAVEDVIREYQADLQSLPHGWREKDMAARLRARARELGLIE